MSIRYNVRSRFLVDIVNDLKAKKLIIAPYFQRKLVWRDAHKVDFIKTILLGYPFPEVFFSRGRINLEDMSSTSSVVDGQQRLSAILQFVDNHFPVDGRFFRDYSNSEKESFFKYEIAVIDLDLPDNDATIVDIFNRLNRTFYALSTIEKQATEYASAEFMLVAKLLAGELGASSGADTIEMDAERVAHDPNLSDEFVRWCTTMSVKPFHRWLLESGTFSAYEISRQVHLTYTLLVMSTFMSGIFQRNEQVKTDLERFAETFSEKENIISRICHAADVVERIRPHQFWRRKANAFTLIVAVDTASKEGIRFVPRELKGKLSQFADSPPDGYALAAKEGVNNRKERLFRHKHVCRSIFGIEV